MAEFIMPSVAKQESVEEVSYQIGTIGTKLNGVENGATKDTTRYWLGTFSSSNKAFVSDVLNAVCNSSMPTGKLCGIYCTQSGWATYLGVAVKESSTGARCFLFDDDERVYFGRRNGSTYYASKFTTSKLS